MKDIMDEPLTEQETLEVYRMFLRWIPAHSRGRDCPMSHASTCDNGCPYKIGSSDCAQIELKYFIEKVMRLSKIMEINV